MLLLLVVFCGCDGRDIPKKPGADQAGSVREKIPSNGIPGFSQAKNNHEMISAVKNPDERLYERLQYSLWIETELGGTMEGAFQDDNHLLLASAFVGGNLLIYVNDSPVRLHCRGSSVFPIYDLLGPGRNRVRVVGKRPERMFMKVVAVDPNRFRTTFEVEEVLAKSWLDPRLESITLEFDTKLTKGPDYQTLPSEVKPGDALYQEVRTLIDHWATCCNDHDADALFESSMPTLKSPPPYLGHRDAAKLDSKQLIDAINGRKFRLVTKADDVQIVFGKRSVLVYAGVTHDTVAPLPYLFELKSDEGLEPAFVQAAAIARLEGKWFVIR